MKPFSLRFLSLAAFAALAVSGQAAHAQDRVYRCPGNEYINNPNDAQTRGCRLVEGGNVTVVQGGSGIPGTQASAPVRSPGTAAGQRVDAGDQKARDGDARAILEGELRKAEARQADLLKEYNNGEPEKVGAESRNYQRYLDRVNEMKAAIARNEADIAGIKRELARLASR